MTHLWSGRFSGAPDAAVFEWGKSLSVDHRLIEDDITEIAQPGVDAEVVGDVVAVVAVGGRIQRHQPQARDAQGGHPPQRIEGRQANHRTTSAGRLLLTHETNPTTGPGSPGTNKATAPSTQTTASPDTAPSSKPPAESTRRSD